MTKRPQNGPTFSKPPPKKRRPMTDAELADLQSRKDAELEEKKRDAARERISHQRLRINPVEYLQELARKNKCPHCGSISNQRPISPDEVIPGRATVEARKRNSKRCGDCQCLYDADNGTILAHP